MHKKLKNQLNSRTQAEHKISLNKRILRVVTLAFVLFMTYFLVSDYFTTIHHAEQLSLHKLQGIVNDLAIQINGDQHQELSSQFRFREDIRYSQQDQKYQAIHDILDRTHQAHDLSSPVYTFVKPENGAENSLQFIVTSSEAPYYRHWYTSFPKLAYEQLDQGGKIKLYKDEYGHWLSAFAPIKNNNGKVVAYVQADQKFDHFIYEVREKTLWNALICLFGFSAVVVLLLPYLKQLLKEEERQKSIMKKSLEETKRLSLKLSANENQLKENTIKLQQSNKDLHDFAHIASHDLKAPIRNIHSFSQLLLRRNGDQLDENAKEYMEYIINSAESAQKLINGLLSYSTADKDLGEQIVFPMRTAVECVQNNLTSLMKDRRAEIVFGEMGEIKANPTLVSQILQNLINNGIKYNQSEKPTIEIGTGIHSKKGKYFFVRDNGIGIAEEHQAGIFDMFTRLHSSRDYEGSGIGLAFCHRVVAAYGGTMWLESIPGEGSVFFFTLPHAIFKSTAVMV